MSPRPRCGIEPPPPAPGGGGGGGAPKPPESSIYEPPCAVGRERPDTTPLRKRFPARSCDHPVLDPSSAAGERPSNPGRAATSTSPDRTAAPAARRAPLLVRPRTGTTRHLLR